MAQINGEIIQELSRVLQPFMWDKQQRRSYLVIALGTKEANPSTRGHAMYNFRVPAHLCFAVAIVDTVDEITASKVQTTNPLDHNLDLLWYEVPVIYEISRKQLYFYDKPSNILENFKGEIVWKKLRPIVKDILPG
ncbi:MAG: hypothetical protein KME52_21380 [Desmonostoc geniculatum HA4340-LM1]|jgi:hypothetical protein|nr:hypothetical protein [Desmonostoc geniculatum HA4340-LM1]